MKRSIHLSRLVPAALALTAFSCALSLSLLSTGCGGGGNNPLTQSAAASKQGSVTMRIKWPRPDGTRKIPLAAKSITISIVGPGGTQRKTVQRPDNGSPSTVTFTDLPIRGSYTLTGSAFASTDGTGVVLAKASTTVIFTVAQPNQTVVLDLATTIVRLAVTPDPVRLSTTGSRTLSATGYDALTGGNMVPVSNVTYSVADETIAVVSTDPVTGVSTIQGKVKGLTTLTATDTESGVSTTVTVEVGGILQKIWSQDLGARVRSTAIIGANGNIYIGGELGKLFAFTPTGATAASFPVSVSTNPDNPFPVSEPLFIKPNTVYAFDDAGVGVGFDATSGAAQRPVFTGAYVFAPGIRESRVINKPVLAPSGAVYAGTANGTLSKAVGLPGATTVTQIPVQPGTVVSAPAIDPKNGKVYVTSSTIDGLSAKFSGFAADNTPLFPAVTLPDARTVGVALSPDGTKAYVVSGLNAGDTVNVYGINTASGTILWTKTLPDATQVSVGTWGGLAGTDPIGGQVFGLDGGSGNVKPGWPFQIPYQPGFLFSDVDSSVLVAPDGSILFGSLNGNIYVLGSDGAKILEAAALEEIHATPTLGPDGTVYVGSDDGLFTAFH